MSSESRGRCLEMFLLLFIYLLSHGEASPPTVIGPPVVIEGDSISLHCDTGSNEAVQWFKDGVTVSASDPNFDTSQSNISISSANATVHTGTYSCSLTSNQSEVSTPFQLTVYYFHGNLSICKVRDNNVEILSVPSILNPDLLSYTVNFNSDVLITCCTPPAVPPVQNVSWIKNGGTPRPSNGGDSSEGWSLLLSDIAINDRGKYQCSYEHVARGTIQSEEIELKVADLSSTPATPIKVTVPQTTVCTKPGNTVTIHCTVSGTVSSEGVSWTLGDNSLPSSERFSVDPVTNSLTITNAALSDDGVYKCIAINGLDEDSATVHLNMTCIHSVHVSPSSVSTGLGTSKTLACSSNHDDSLATPTYSWLTPQGITVQGPQLVLNNLQYSDTGSYNCTASSPDSLPVSSLVSLTVLGPPLVRITTSPYREARLYRTLTLLCSVNVSVLGQEIKWSKENSSNRDFILSDSLSSNILTIRNFNVSDVGVYHCSYTSNTYREVKNSVSVVLTSEIYPKFDIITRTGIINENLIVTCEFLGGINSDGMLTMSWFKGGFPLRSSRNVSVTNGVVQGGVATLTINSLKMSDEGSYSCLASDGVHEFNETFEIIVNIPGSFLEVPPSSVQYMEGEYLYLECRVVGKPLPEVTWLKELSPLESDDRIIMNSNGSLTITSIVMSDAGDYLCFFDRPDSDSKEISTVTIKVSPRQATPTALTGDDTILGLEQNLFISIVLAAVGVIFIILIVLLLCCALCYVKCRSRDRSTNGHQKAVLETVSFERRPSLRGSLRKDNSGILQQNPSDLSSLWTFTTDNSNSVPMTAVSSSVAVSPGPPVPSPIPPPPDGPTASLATELNLPHGITSFPRHKLMLSGDIMGEGEFGPVVKAIARHITEDSSETLVAVKVLMSREGEEALWPSLMEFSNQMRLSSPFISKILGICADAEPYYVIYEYLDRGDLKNFLFASHPSPHSEPMLTQSDLLHFVSQIAEGMRYLYTQQIIHGDLATRNCLISSNFSVKIADLGIGHDLYEQDYYDNGSQLLPIRWMAPELLKDSNMGPAFSLASDIWSFGVFCWEVFSYARQPYEGLSDEQVLRLVPSGHLLSLPEEGMPALLYSLLMDCWQYDPLQRPLFTEIAPAVRGIDVD